MMIAEGLTIDVDPTIEDSRAGVAARIQPLGLTAYGETPYQALGRLQLMLEMAIFTRRRLGRLESWLLKSGLKWDDPQGLRSEDGAL